MKNALSINVGSFLYVHNISKENISILNNVKKKHSFGSFMLVNVKGKSFKEEIIF